MGYREVNWSLPREQQVIHTRQNIYDGTWQKAPSMGWMFVPLTEYQGGGAAATIEPLDQHLDHYQRMLDSNLALGVQACYRGPRLFDDRSFRPEQPDDRPGTRVDPFGCRPCVSRCARAREPGGGINTGRGLLTPPYVAKGEGQGSPCRSPLAGGIPHDHS